MACDRFDRLASVRHSFQVKQDGIKMQFELKRLGMNMAGNAAGMMGFRREVPSVVHAQLTYCLYSLMVEMAMKSKDFRFVCAFVKCQR